MCSRNGRPFAGQLLGFPELGRAQYRLHHRRQDRHSARGTASMMSSRHPARLHQVNDDHGCAIAARPSRGGGLPWGALCSAISTRAKLTPDVFAGWMRILGHVEQRAVAAARTHALCRKYRPACKAMAWRRSASCRAQPPPISIWRDCLCPTCSRQPALQCPYHRQRCFVGRRAVADAPRHRFRPRRRQPAYAAAWNW